MRHLLVSALLVGGLASIGCMGGSGSPDIPANAQRVTVEPLAAAEPMRSNSGISERQRLVVRDAASWETLWKQIVEGRRPEPPVPAIDFARSVIVVAAMGTKGGGGHTIDVDTVHTLQDDAWISVVERFPGPTCVVTLAITSPVDIVVVPRFEGTATFVEDSEQVSCE